jgi:hydroxymethylpyrimidine/phosphomethylpyrimidine kinase
MKMITMSAPMARWNAVAALAECESLLRSGACKAVYLHAGYRLAAAMVLSKLFAPNHPGILNCPPVFKYSQRIQPINHGPCCRYAAAILANVTKGRPIQEPYYQPAEIPGYSDACGYHD